MGHFYNSRTTDGMELAKPLCILTTICNLLLKSVRNVSIWGQNGSIWVKIGHFYNSQTPDRMKLTKPLL